MNEELLAEIKRVLNNHSGEYSALKDDLEKLVARMSNTISRIYSAQNVSEIYSRWMDDLNEEQNVGLTTGLEVLDKAMGGFQAGEIIVLAARPGMGMRDVALKAVKGIQENFPVLYISTQLSAVDMMKRYFYVSTGRIFKNPDPYLDPVHEVFEEGLQSSQLYFLDDEFDTWAELKKIIVSHSDIHKVKAIVIDYYQHMRIRSGLKGMDLILRLKDLARELKIVLILMTSVSRDVEWRGGDRRPMLSDVYDNGELEQEADKVLMVYRPDYYGFIEDEYGESTIGRTEIIVVKDNKGYRGTLLINEGKGS